MSEPDVPFRLLPQLDERNTGFWTGGEQGELRITHCSDCGMWIHPPIPLCPGCHSKKVAAQATSGRGQVHTFTVNHQPWMPGPELPYVVAIVELAEDPSVRLTTNLVGVAPEDVHIGMPVRAVFEHHADELGDVWLPLFEPEPRGDA
jgi:uncharacterized OB-fold protein